MELKITLYVQEEHNMVLSIYCPTVWTQGKVVFIHKPLGVEKHQLVDLELPPLFALTTSHL